MEVEVAEHGVMEFMATDFEIHFRAVDRLGTKIVESDDGLFASLSFQHEAGRHHYG